MGNKKVLLMVLDGFGQNENTEGNAIFYAQKPNIDKIFNENPNTKIHTSGLHVGLPEGQMGNSEVGHTNIGAGRVVYQELTRITKSIKDGDFFEKEEFLETLNIQEIKEKKEALESEFRLEKEKLEEIEKLFSTSTTSAE